MKNSKVIFVHVLALLTEERWKQRYGAGFISTSLDALDGKSMKLMPVMFNSFGCSNSCNPNGSFGKWLNQR